MNKAMRFVAFSCLISVVCVTGVQAIAPGDPEWPTSYPDWWYNTSNPANGLIDGTLPALNENNATVLNQGQLWNIADQTISELYKYLKPVGGVQISLSDFLQTGATADYNAPANVGQLKNVASKFYDRLSQVGFTYGATGWPATLILNEESETVVDEQKSYPWRYEVTAENRSPALLGQAKHLFSWRLREFFEEDTEDNGDGSLGDGLPDWWEMYFFGDLDEEGQGDFDNDGILNQFELQGYTSPILDQVSMLPAESTGLMKYTYDNLGRLRTTAGSVDLTFTYDDEGNLKVAN